MHEAALRTVLLIRSIDEGDQAGEVLSLTERAEATQAAAQGSDTIPNAGAGQVLPPAAERILVRRAELLLGKLQSRAPVIRHVLALAGGSSALGWLLLGVAFASGALLSALDGSHQIDILDVPLLGLIAWNLCVYLALVVGWLRSRRAPRDGPSWPSALYARWVRGRADALLRRSSRFNVPLSQALQRFARDWAVVSRPLWLLRGARIFHIGAALLALGLVTGLYVRGLVLRYDAGWDSTFLDPGQVHTLLRVVYAPAAALSGTPLPSLEQVRALRFQHGAGGAPAAPWIQLIALTAGLTIVLPRMLAAALTSAALWRARRRPNLPAAFSAYAHSILRQTGRVSAFSVAVVSYAYELSRDARAGLTALLSDALGSEVKLELRNSVAYGEEDALSERVRHKPLAPADAYVLVMSAASTPESENHGAVIKALQGSLAKQAAGLLLVVDESAYAARMGDDPSLASRMAERARSWREFSAGFGATACVVNLSRLRSSAALDQVRKALSRPVAS